MSSQAWRVFWERDRGPAGLDASFRQTDRPCCLGSAGFIANRDRLLAEVGAKFGTTDAALISALAERYGVDRASQRVAGPFSFLLWDPAVPRLVAVRDRSGAGDPAWQECGRSIRFAPLAELAGRTSGSDGLDISALLGHLCGMGPPEGHTSFRTIARLEPGELIEFTAAGSNRRRYWRAHLQRPARPSSDRGWAEELRSLLLRVVGEYVPDGNSGITLSGGMDSTSVAAAFRRSAPMARLCALVWTSPELPEADEAEPAHAVCKRLGIEAIDLRADLCWPLSDGTPAGAPEGPDLAFYPELWARTFGAAREAGIGTLFTGASGDNLFGGEVCSYPDLLLTFRWADLVRQLRSHLAWTELGGLGGIVRRLVVTPMRRSWFDAGRPQPPAWLTDRARESAEPLLAAARPPRGFLPGRRQLLVQLRERLPAMGIAQLGRAAARLGIELRHPLLDHRLVDFAAGLPADQLFRAGERKFVLRNAMRSDLPEEVVSRRRKIVPVEIFHRGVRERGRELIEELLREMRSADLGLIEPARLRAGYEEYAQGVSRDSRFWQAFTLEAWLRRYR